MQQGNRSLRAHTRLSQVTLGLGMAALLATSLTAALPTGVVKAAAFADPAFNTVWDRTDKPVAGHQASRSWYWGPVPGQTKQEPYAEGVGGTRMVQYFDKSRMEINNPSGDKNSKFYVTNGLLTIELMAGKIQTGNNKYQDSYPAYISIAGDAGDSKSPTYAAFAGVSNTPLGDHKVSTRNGEVVQEVVSRAGAITPTSDNSRYGVRYVRFEPLTGHNIPSVFWDTLTARGPVRENGVTGDALLSDPWFFTSGLPISEAYWARVKIAGAPHDVLIQCFERRVLTYVPDNAPEWRVQVGNIGSHYQQWRYPRGLPLPGPAPTAVPTVGR